MRQSINIAGCPGRRLPPAARIYLIELIVATAILAILVGRHFRLVRMTIYREREHELALRPLDASRRD